MLFNSMVFLFAFLPATLVSMEFTRRIRAGSEKYVLILASLVFYGYWSRRFLLMLVVAVFINWVIAGFVIRHRERRFLLVLGIAANLLLLGFFKYTNFLASIVSAAGLWEARTWDIALPLAISFFTFHQISYLIDISRGDDHAYDFSDYLLYIVFFPHLIAGPIVRHNEFIYQIRERWGRAVPMDSMARGVTLFVIGLAKKMLLANELAAVADGLFQLGLTQDLSITQSLLATLSFALQIYFDFSAYTDMAIGLSLMMGYRLPVNFNAPYAALSLIDFWRRWHMTLSRFLRDYLYISMGGNRRGRLRQYCALFTTMLLGGLWHGANWTFVAWGALHGAGLCVNHFFKGLGFAMPRFVAWLLTFSFVALCFVFFRAESIAHAGRVLHGFTTPWGQGAQAESHAVLMIVALGVAVFGPTAQAFTESLVPRKTMAFVTGAVGALCVLAMLAADRNAPFIYFQF